MYFTCYSIKYIIRLGPILARVIMAVPKRKQSKTRGRKRRTNWKLKDSSSLQTCTETNTTHHRHRAYYVDGVLYFKGEILQNNQ